VAQAGPVFKPPATLYPRYNGDPAQLLTIPKEPH
jgi:hypothetical protein